MTQLPAPTALNLGQRGAAGDAVQYLTFTVDDEVFAIDIGHVREIIQHNAMTVVPLMPPFVRGVINLRGAVVPVIDLQARFGRARAQLGKKTSIIILDVNADGEHVALGLLVDAVRAVVDLPPACIEPTPQFGTSIAREFIRALGKVGDEFIVILEPERALNMNDMVSLAVAN